MNLSKLIHHREIGFEQGKHYCQIEITPRDALTVLKTRSIQNRTFKKHTINLYRRLIANNAWHENGENISFASLDKDGNELKKEVLINGYHRLTACVEADTTFYSDIRFGLKLTEEVLSVIDTATSRSLNDTRIIIEGNREDGSPIFKSNILDATKKDFYVIYVLEKEVWHTNSDIGRICALDISNPTFCKTTENILESVQKTSGLAKAAIRGRSHHACFHYYMSEILNRRHEADLFIEQLAEGTWLNKRTPAYSLREYFLSCLKSRIVPPKALVGKITTLAWNMHILKRPMNSVNYYLKNEEKIKNLIHFIRKTSPLIPR